MTDLDPAAWLGRHPRLTLLVLLPTATIGFWIGQAVASGWWLKGSLLFGAMTTSCLVIFALLLRPFERFAKWFVNSAITKAIVHRAVEIRGLLVSHGLLKSGQSKGKHAWDYVGWCNPVHVYSLQARLANK